MTLTDRLLTAARVWSDATGRSEATLASQVARDGKYFDRLRSGRSCTLAVAERFFAVFRDPASWPAGVPAELADCLDGVDLGAHAPSDTDVVSGSSPGIGGDLSPAVQHA